ncbi:MAG: FAD-binding oxidoreductase, partial [Chromatiales bacterium]|nr:FAD-binding oxidoreductase [Chromatiales bacterium]
MKAHYDVVIIGGGVSGSSTAYFLAADADFDGSVLVVERDPTYENAPSAKASGGIRQQFSTPENIRIGLFGAHFVKHAADYLGVDGDDTG